MRMMREGRKEYKISIDESKILYALSNKFYDCLMLSLSILALNLELRGGLLLQVVDAHLHLIEHLLLGRSDQLQLLLQRHHLPLEFVDQPDHTPFALLYLSL
jgi:hypothetical protein